MLPRLQTGYAVCCHALWHGTRVLAGMWRILLPQVGGVLGTLVNAEVQLIKDVAAAILEAAVHEKGHDIIDFMPQEWQWLS